MYHPQDARQQVEAAAQMPIHAEDKETIWQVNHRQGVPFMVDRDGDICEACPKEPILSPTHWDTSQLSRFLEVKTAGLPYAHKLIIMT